MPIINIVLTSKADLSGFRELEKAVTKGATSIGAFGAKLGIGMFGAQNAAGLLKNEIRHVIENIDKIPGVPGETIDSITRAKFLISETREEVDQWIAKGVTAFSQFGEGLGYFFGSLVYGQDAAAEAYAQTQRAADTAAQAAREARTNLEAQAVAAKQAQAEQKAFEAAIAAFRTEDQIGESLGARIARLRGEVKAKEAEAGPASGLDKAASYTAAAEASKLRAELAKAELELNERLASVGERQRETDFEKLSAKEKLALVTQDIAALEAGIAATNLNDPVQAEKFVELETRRLELVKQLTELKKESAAADKKAADDALDAQEKRLDRLQAERAIAEQNGDRAEVNRLLVEEKSLLQQIAAAYRAIAETATTPAEKEAALARAAAADKSISDAGGRTSRIGRAEQDVQNLSNPADNYQGIGEGARGGVLEYLSEVGTMATQVADGIRSTIGTAVSSITDGIVGWINGTMTWRQAMTQMRNTILQKALETVVQIGVQQGINFVITKTGMLGIEALGDTLRTARVVKENAAEAATLPAKTAGAAAAGISSFGVALVFGALALALIAGAMGAFATGGYTAQGPREKPAGVVHAGEWVAPKWMVQDARYGNLIAMLEMERQGKSGYGFGGLVDMAISGWIPKKHQPKFITEFQDKYNLFKGTYWYGDPTKTGPDVRPSDAELGINRNAASSITRPAYQPAGAGEEGAPGGGGQIAGGTRGERPIYIVFDKEELRSQLLSNGDFDARVVDALRRNQHRLPG